MKSFFLLLLLGLVSLNVNAQTTKELPEAVATPIAYERLVPTSIRSHAKKPYQTKFFGWFHGPSGSDLAIHYYLESQGQIVKEPHTPDEKYIETFTLSRPFRLDLFKRRKGEKQWHLLNSVPVRYSSFEMMKPVDFGARFTWLDDLRKRIPVLMLDCYDPNGMGSFGYKVLVVFPAGWSQPSVTQGFIYGGGPSSGFAGQGPRFERDDHGLLQVRVSYHYNHPEEDYAEIYVWNGQTFAVTQRVPPLAVEATNVSQP